MKFGDMQRAIKGYKDLHSKGIGLVFHKYYYARNAMWKSIKANHENSGKVKMPYKEKKYFNTGWDYQCIRINYENGVILLTRPMKKEGDKWKRQTPVKCYAKSIPDNIVEIELICKKGLKLAIKYKETDIENVIQSNKCAAIDLGEIHSITSIDADGKAIIITGRKIRSIKRLRNKELAKIQSLQNHCRRRSRKYKKYKKAMYNLKVKTDNQVKDAVHKITKLYLDYCLENNIGSVYYGDVDSATRNTKGKVNKHNGQKLNEWCYGFITEQLENKLNRYGIKIVKVKEYFTTKICPNCGQINEPERRNYICDCGYTQHRDIVGAINILNNNCGSEITKYTNKTYLRIA